MSGTPFDAVNQVDERYQFARDARLVFFGHVLRLLPALIWGRTNRAVRGWPRIPKEVTA